MGLLNIPVKIYDLPFTRLFFQTSLISYILSSITYTELVSFLPVLAFDVRRGVRLRERGDDGEQRHPLHRPPPPPLPRHALPHLRPGPTPSPQIHCEKGEVDMDMHMYVSMHVCMYPPIFSSMGLFVPSYSSRLGAWVGF